MFSLLRTLWIKVGSDRGVQEHVTSIFEAVASLLSTKKAIKDYTNVE